MGTRFTALVVKAYSKGEELEARGHRLPDALSDTLIPTWADDKLRIELRLKKKELRKRGIMKIRDLPVTAIPELYRDYVTRLDMKEQVCLSTKEAMALPNRLLSTYTLWKDGHDLRALLPRASYYRHRKELLNHGIDIAFRQDVEDRTNVIPLVRVLEAKPVSVPEWAFEEGLIHSSARAL